MTGRDEEAVDHFEDETGGRWELDPTDPDHPDFDLSEASSYSDWERPRGFLPLRRWVVLLVTVLVLLALIWPACARILD